MNILTVAIAVLMAAIITVSAMRGFLKMGFSLIALGLAIACTTIFTPKVNEVLSTSQYVQNFAQSQAESYTDRQIGDANEITEENIENLPIPDVMKGMLESAAGSVLESTGDAAETIREEVIDQVVSRVIYAVSAVITFVLSVIIMFLIKHFLLRLLDLPALGAANHLGGLLLGILQAFLVVWLILTVISLISFTSVGQALYAQVEESYFLTWLNSHNLILQLFYNRAQNLLMVD